MVFKTAQAASFLILYSDRSIMSKSFGNMLQSMTAYNERKITINNQLAKMAGTNRQQRVLHNIIPTCICILLPAVVLDIAQHASFLTLERGWSKSNCIAGRTDELMTTCVWTSSPVNMLPIALRAGEITDTSGCL